MSQGGANLEESLTETCKVAIRDSFQSLKSSWEKELWLPENNSFKKNSVKIIKQHVEKGTKLRHIELSKYIAASVAIHCFDGWSYLGRALESEMAGDPDVARHLGYYAELRAAMSILASEGTGVFKDYHIAVTKNGKCKLVTKKQYPTHVFVWKAFNIWANSEDGRNAIIRLIRPGGSSLSAWLDQFTSGTKALPSELLTRWGFDLSQFARDREARNLASYRPTALTSPGPRQVKSTIRTILHMWEVCEPGVNGGFPILDSCLLRHALNFYCSQSSYTKMQYEDKLHEMINNVGPVERSIEAWNEFLSYDNLQKTSPIINDAGKEDDSNHLEHSKQVLARAILLLRVATGCTASLLEETETSVQNDLGFWTSSASVRRRLWPESEPFPTIVDLWQDIADASSQITDWLGNGRAPNCPYTLWTEIGSSLSMLGTTERVFLWGADS